MGNSFAVAGSDYHWGFGSELEEYNFKFTDRFHALEAGFSSNHGVYGLLVEFELLNLLGN